MEVRRKKFCWSDFDGYGVFGGSGKGLAKGRGVGVFFKGEKAVCLE